METHHRVLVVDDDAVTLDLMTRYLVQAGIEDIVVAASAQKALSILETTPFDLVILDLMMPGMNGYDLTVLIRKKLRLEELPLIAITSQGVLESSEHAREIGLDLIVPKPITLQKVRDMLCHFLLIN